MPIFSRRIIQRLLNENRSFLPEIQIKSHVNKLNAKNNDSIATEWEVVILNVLSKIGRVRYEKKLNAKTPDIFVETFYAGEFIAEITAISDESYDKKNPISYFIHRLNNYFQAQGLTTKGLYVEIDSKMVGKNKDRIVQLCLPEKKDIPSFIKKEFHPIVECIKRRPSKAFSSKIREGNASFTIAFNPLCKYFSYNHTCHTAPYSIEKNPIFNRLKKKAGQLRKTEYQGIMGIFVCDAACDSLNKGFHCADEYSQNKIIQTVFKNNTSISFVIIITPEEQLRACGTISPKFIKSDIYLNEWAKYPVKDNFCQQMEFALKFFPIPQVMPKNAKYRLKLNKDEGYSHYGAFTMNVNRITIPSRMITELLAGVLDFSKFDKDYKTLDMDNKNYVKEFFLRQLQEGNMIDKISIEKCPDKDDDWIEFEYGTSDPAISKFK